MKEFNPGFCTKGATKDAIAIYLLDQSQVESSALTTLSLRAQNWVNTTGFKAAGGAVLLVSDDEGELDSVILGLGPKEVEDQEPFVVANLPAVLPKGKFRIVYADHENRDPVQDAFAWALGQYQFDRYKKVAPREAELLLDDKISNVDELVALSSAVAFGRDLITTPTNDMGPQEIADAASMLATRFDADIDIVEGEALLEKNFPLVHAVGRASILTPRLIDLKWGDNKHPKVTLVGKGVAFDTGGLDIKAAAGMLLMKKDMGGAANVLALAFAIMEMKLPIQLRVIIPAVENAISSNAFRPSDVLTARNGKTIEIGNTDAEGRLILADALALAGEDEPELIIDMATLTGAGRVALGLEVPCLFSNNAELADTIQEIALQQSDPLWHMPLWRPYKKMLASKIADMNNVGSSPYGGAITAALFLSEFVPKEMDWVHVDLMGYTTTPSAGKPVGGEVQGIRALYHSIKSLYGEPNK